MDLALEEGVSGHQLCPVKSWKMGCLVRSAECSASPIVVGPWYYRFLPFGVHLESDFCPSHTVNHGRQDEIVVPALSAASAQLLSPKGVMNE